jgi:hypothetical protein
MRFSSCYTQTGRRTDRETDRQARWRQYAKLNKRKNKLQLLHRQEAKDLQGKYIYVPGNL